MCDKNIIELANINFGSVNDEFNWVTTGSTAIETSNGQLKLVPTDQSTSFSRALGILNANNDRVRLQINLDLYRPQTSQHDKMNVVFGVYNGSQLIDQFSLFVDNIESGAVVTCNFERFYKYSELSGNVSLRITVPTGYQNQIFLDYLKAWNQKFCEDSVRTYFAFEDFFKAALDSQSSAIQLVEWKIDDAETLTQEFFDENNSPGGDPSAEWFPAFAELDGSNRVSEQNDPNTFNPFESEFGLTFEDVGGNFHGGKPTAVTSGSNYGPGIMTLGLEKPNVLNGDLEAIFGAFFIDLDYSKNLKVVFNVLVNNTNANPFNSPDMFRKYTIEWNVDTCSKRFFYQDQLSATPNSIIPVDEFGFLYGLTPPLSLTEIVGCDQSFSFNGNAGTFEFQIDFGTAIGEAGINYDALNVPDKFEIEWNGQKFSSGFVGSSTYDQQLLNLGIPQSEIKTGNPSTGAGQLKFQKTSASPSSAIVRVNAPLGNTGWNISGICPNGIVTSAPTVDLTSSKPDYAVKEQITFNISANDDSAIASWVIDFGDGTTQNGTGNPPVTITHTYNTQGSKNIKITVTDNDGLTGSDSLTLIISTDSQYKIDGNTTANCSSGMSGTIEVTSGFLTLQNKTFFYSGQNPAGAAAITINDGTTNVAVLNDQEMFTIGVGNYTFSSGPVDCSSGSGVTSLITL